MLDVNLFRNDLPAVAAGLAKRGLTLDIARFEALESARKDIQVRTQDLQSKRNAASKQIGAAKAKGQDASAILAEVAGLGDEVKRLETELESVQAQLRDFLLVLPNLTHASTPEGKSGDVNVEVRPAYAEQPPSRAGIIERNPFRPRRRSQKHARRQSQN